MPEGGSALQPYDPANPPSDVANTTTDQGKTVPFIVRQERGALDRDEFRIAVLYQPGKPWQPWAPPARLQPQARRRSTASAATPPTSRPRRPTC